MTQARQHPRARVARLLTLLCVGVLTLTGCDFSVYSMPLPGGADLGDKPYAVTVKFRDVLDLVPQSAVKVNDVTVGKVESVDLDGYTAEVKVLLRDGVKLPDNAEAEIRQTSLLGEKFVSLKAPDVGASRGLLGDGDVIPLDRSGRNPEVEEVLGAMSLLLNGGGVAQLKTIASELNKALDGREADARSVFEQIDLFMKQIDQNKMDIVNAIESLNRLAESINQQRSSIELTLDEMPGALASIDRQRDDLVKMLKALSNLSSVATGVIRDSKAATIDSLQALAPTLTKLAEAGDALPKSLQVFLTYPFVDAVVGKNPAQARNLHMGDYTNLSVQLDLDLTHMPDGSAPPPVPTLSLKDIIAKCADVPIDKLSDACKQLLSGSIDQVCKTVPNSPLCTSAEAKAGSTGGGGGSLQDQLSGTLSGLGLNRAAPSNDERGSRGSPTYDSTLGALLVGGMVQR